MRFEPYHDSIVGCVLVLVSARSGYSEREREKNKERRNKSSLTRMYPGQSRRRPTLRWAGTFNKISRSSETLNLLHVCASESDSTCSFAWKLTRSSNRIPNSLSDLVPPPSAHHRDPPLPPPYVAVCNLHTHSLPLYRGSRLGITIAQIYELASARYTPIRFLRSCSLLTVEGNPAGAYFNLDRFPPPRWYVSKVLRISRRLCLSWVYCAQSSWERGEDAFAAVYIVKREFMYNCVNHNGIKIAQFNGENLYAYVFLLLHCIHSFLYWAENHAKDVISNIYNHVDLWVSFRSSHWLCLYWDFSLYCVIVRKGKSSRDVFASVCIVKRGFMYSYVNRKRIKITQFNGENLYNYVFLQKISVFTSVLYTFIFVLSGKLRKWYYI